MQEAFSGEGFVFELTPALSDRLVACVRGEAHLGEIMPVLVHEYVHAFLTDSPLCSLITKTRQDVTFVRNQFCFSNEVNRLEEVFHQEQVADAISEYTSFWQEGLATFTELRTRYDRWADECWADSVSGFRLQLATLSNGADSSDAALESCRMEQTQRFERVLKLPCPDALAGSYLIPYLVIEGIHECVRDRIPEITIDSFLELMRLVIFCDRSVWLGAATATANASNGILDDLAGLLRRSFEAGFQGVIAFLLDLSAMSEADCAELIHRVETRRYAINDGFGFLQAELPMLRRWTERSIRISGELVDEVCSNIRLGAERKMLRTPVERLKLHGEPFSYFEFYGLDPQNDLEVIDVRDGFAFDNGETLGFHLEGFRVGQGHKPTFEIRKSELLIWRGLTNFDASRYTLFRDRISGKLGAALIGSEYAYLQAFGTTFEPSDQSRIYRSLLRNFYFSSVLLDRGEGSPFQFLVQFQAKRQELSTLDLDVSGGWEPAIDDVAALFPAADFGPASLGKLLRSTSFCPAFDLWFGGWRDTSSTRRCAEFVEAQLRGVYDN